MVEDHLFPPCEFQVHRVVARGADIGGKSTGTLSGAMNMTGAFIGAAGLALAGRLLDQGDYDLMFFAFACSYALAALCWLAVDVTRPLVPRAS